MKNTVINLRVSENLKQELELNAFDNEKSLSELIREVLNDFAHGKTTGADTVNRFNHIPHDGRVDLLGTFKFTELVFWIMHKQTNPEFNEPKELYMSFVKLIDELCNHRLVTSELLRELKKISFELECYLNGMPLNMYIMFARYGKPNSFNYDLFEGFIYSLKNDCRANLVSNNK
jgi:hypothetical protein